MTDQFVAEIRIFTGTFAPKGWAFCDGQIMPISQNTALFSLLGTTYGGNGSSNFALPNLQGSAPVQSGQGPGLSLRNLGEFGGEQTVTLLESQMPAHTHTARAYNGVGGASPGVNSTWADATQRGISAYTPSVPQNNTPMSANGLSVTGGSQPHNNMPPYLGLSFIIALQGIFPPHS
jgi:microcystin-dependent protein